MEKKGLRGDLIMLENVKRVVPDFAVMPRDRTRSNEHKINQRKFQLNMMKIFTVRVMEHWNWLPGEAVESPSLEIFQISLDIILYYLL